MSVLCCHLFKKADKNRRDSWLNKTRRESLEGADLSNCTKIEKLAFQIEVRLVSVYDGDTYTVAYYDPLVKKIVKKSCRVLGYDAPEMKPPKNAPNREYIKEKAMLAKKIVEDILKQRPTVFKLDVTGLDKYGRWLVNEPLLKNTLINNSLAYSYDGGTKVDNFGSESIELKIN
jgi:endonuclease YncB( thermonuclease family)